MSMFINHSKLQGSCEIVESDCEYYLCHEMQEPCGPKGYTLNFGYRYCLKYLNEDLYTNPGKSWLSQVRGCLQKSLSDQHPYPSCQDLKKEAINSHFDCYINAGFCDLPRNDQRRILRTAANSILDPEVLKNGLAIIQECYKQGKIIW